MFTYIIPIHNKQDVLPKVLEGVHLCAKPNSKIYAVLDGCVDGSEAVVDDFIRNTGRDVKKLYMPDVHMLKSVNEALRHVVSGYALVLQDDIVLKDPLMEDKLEALYARLGPRLGVVSFRLASNVSTPLSARFQLRTTAQAISETEVIRGPYEDECNAPVCPAERFIPRIGAINGPNCFPPAVLEKVGLLDEALAPFGYDDPEYGLRSTKAGFVNGLFPLAFESEIEWGGTRRDPSFPKFAKKIHRRNRIYIAKKHGKFIKELWQRGCVYTGNDPIDRIEDLPPAWDAEGRG